MGPTHSLRVFPENSICLTQKRPALFRGCFELLIFVRFFPGSVSEENSGEGKDRDRRCTIPAALAFLVGQGEFGGGAEAGTSSKRQQENEVVRASGLDRVLLGREAAEGLNDSWSVLDQPPLVRKLRTDQWDPPGSSMALPLPSGRREF